MKNQFAISFLVFALHAHAADVVRPSQSNDFGGTDKVHEITPQELRDRFELSGDVLIFSPDGEHLASEGGEHRQWKFGIGEQPILSNWKYDSKLEGISFSLRHEWTLDKAGKIRVHIEQFESMERMPTRDVKFGKKIKDENFVLKDFAPINFVVESTPTRKIVARLIPRLEERRDIIEPGGFPIAIEDGVVLDKKGIAWASGFAGSAKFVGIKTTQGSFAMSFFPFKGATEIGYAQDNQIHLKAKDIGLTIYSSYPVVPHGERAKIFGLIDEKKKSEHGSLGTNWSGKDNGFAESFLK